MKVLVSACLLGENCKYNGGNNENARVKEFLVGKEVIPVCPELAAGLGVPRTPIEICHGEVVSRDGNSVDTVIRAAVAQVLQGIRDEQIECCILKSRSPTCGVHQIYDGTFTGTLIDGAGVLAQALKEAGYCVLDDEDLQS